MTTINVIKRDSSIENFDISKISKQLKRACFNLEDVFPDEISFEVRNQLYNNVTTKEIDSVLTLSARAKIELEPNYSYVAGRLLLYQIYKEILGKIDLDNIDQIYKGNFKDYIIAMVNIKNFDKRMLNFDLDKLSQVILPERDYKFKYLGIQTLYDRYFIKVDNICRELPQWFWMWVSMGLCYNENNKEEWVIKFYNMLSEFKACFSTPTLFNSGLINNQLSSCYLSTLRDSADGIMGGLHSQALLSKHAGGLGVDFSNIRAAGSIIKSTGGKSSGVIPYLKIFNDILVSFDQGGKRLGAGNAYIEPWHKDIEDFINVRKSVGDERKRCHDTNISLWVPDLFMEYVEKDKDWYLFCPSECPDLHSSFGEVFNNIYTYYCGLAEAGLMTNYRKIKARDLMKNILKSQNESGYPFITFKDSCNYRYTDIHEGIINSSNLCTEFLRHTIPAIYNKGIKIKEGQIAVCIYLQLIYFHI